MRDIALVTGASSGIGKEFVRQIAKKYKGLDEIWVIARRKDKLRELKKEINFISNELIAECLFNKLYIKTVILKNRRTTIKNYQLPRRLLASCKYS